MSESAMIAPDIFEVEKLHVYIVHVDFVGQRMPAKKFVWRNFTTDAIRVPRSWATKILTMKIYF